MLDWAERSGPHAGFASNAEEVGEGLPRRQSRDTSSDLPLLPGRRGMVIPGGTLPIMAGRCSVLRAVEVPTRVKSPVTVSGDCDPSLTPSCLLDGRGFARVSLDGGRNEVAATARRRLRSDPHSAEKELGGTSREMPVHLRREAPLTTTPDVADILGEP